MKHIHERIIAFVLHLLGYSDRFPLSPPALEGGGGKEQADGLPAGVQDRANQRKPPPDKHGEREAHQRAQGKEVVELEKCFMNRKTQKVKFTLKIHSNLLPEKC